jgi:hypothetical protein
MKRPSEWEQQREEVKEESMSSESLEIEFTNDMESEKMLTFEKQLTYR